MHTDPDAAQPDEADQLALLYDVRRDVAAAMLALATEDPTVHSPMGLLRHPDYGKSKQLLTKAREQAAAQREAARTHAVEHEAAQVLGPKPHDRDPLHYQWRQAAAAYARRDRAPQLWQDELQAYREQQRSLTTPASA